MNLQPKAFAASKGVAAASLGDRSAAVAMARKIESVFRVAFAAGTTTQGKLAPPSAGQQKNRLFVTLAHHDAPMLDRNAAAYWASRGMPATALEMWFDATGLERKKDLLAALQVSASTLSRAKPDTLLDTAVTERMLRQSELFVRAAEVFGNSGSAWMTKPHDLLDGRSPLECATNEFGGARVRQMLNAIEYGGVV